MQETNVMLRSSFKEKYFLGVTSLHDSAIIATTWDSISQDEYKVFQGGLE